MAELPPSIRCVGPGQGASYVIVAARGGAWTSASFDAATGALLASYSTASGSSLNIVSIANAAIQMHAAISCAPVYDFALYHNGSCVVSCGGALALYGCPLSS